MEDIKNLAKSAKQRLKNNFWQDCKKTYETGEKIAKEKGINSAELKSGFKEHIKKEIVGEKQDEFYLKVKHLLDTEGEVSDAIGRLTDKAYFDTLSYEEKQRYTLRLSGEYLKALERYKRESRNVFTS